MDEITGERLVPASCLEEALTETAAGAAERDARPVFPREPFEKLAETGVLALAVPESVEDRTRRSSFAEEWETLRAVARAEGSVGRILDGHFNGVERVSVLAPEPLRSEELEAVAAGELLLGVWGADPIPGEGEPAKLFFRDGEPCIEGVKTFCSGATGVDRALVLVRGEAPGPPHLVYVDLSEESVEIDEQWFRGSGMRASCSYRVVFHDTPVLAVLGEPGEISREPYFGRDAVRTATTWAGVADAVVESAIETLAAKSATRDPDDIESLAAGKMLTEQATIDRWFERAARLADEDPRASMTSFSVTLREAVASSCRRIMDEAERACGSRPFAVGDTLDRASRDLRIFLLQHRLEPQLAKLGKQAIEEKKR